MRFACNLLQSTKKVNKMPIHLIWNKIELALKNALGDLPEKWHAPPGTWGSSNGHVQHLSKLVGKIVSC
ncbi:hypothetical protein HRM2_15380 [Desulforapulum autotrophicum HRM2]|uniref:Uncharacterized protein n=1 Tax=Desulforapulum autotrophicum (strain ATCC 43914 / DSM 3382 / VKM B-1955 / HRM2) TaxID=177437 RepID=C0QA62_DESAH|nr:hypothetical protein HRM2_15380 [Desulforapulum autotrophicum HRM2]